MDCTTCTIKESFQYIWENLNQRVIENRADPTDLSGIENSLSCFDTMLDRLKIDTFGNSFILTCTDEWTKQTWPISKHLYEILNQLTTGHLADNINGLNKVSEPIYPNLNWAIELK